MKKLLSLAVVSLLVLSCGKDDKRSSKYPALNGEQRSSFSKFTTSAEHAVQAPIDMKKGKRFGEMVADLSSDYTRRQMVQKLDQGHCNVNYSNNLATNSGQVPSFAGNQSAYLTVGGNACPASMDVQFRSSMSSNSMEMSFSAKYSVTDASYKSLNDITGFDISGSFKATADQNSYKGNGEVNGNVQSTQYGNVKVGMTMDMSGDKDKSEMLAVATFTFPTYTAEIRIVSEGSKENQKVDYYLNGEKLEPKQAKQIKAIVGLN